MEIDNEMTRATDPNGAGKGDDYRRVNPIKWNRGWLRRPKFGFKCPWCNKSGDESEINENCKLCGGVGYLDKKYWKVCKVCKGTGVCGVPDFISSNEICTIHECENCGGIGYIQKNGLLKRSQ